MLVVEKAAEHAFGKRRARVDVHLENVLIERITTRLPQSRATTEIVRAAIMFSLLKHFFPYSAIIAMKFGRYIPEGLEMMIL